MKHKIVVSLLGLSAAGLIGLVHHEGYVEQAMIPTENDRPTVGFGSTYHADGRPVRLGDKTTPVKALLTLQAHVTKEEKKFQESLPGVKLSQAEYDLYIDWLYQYGLAAWLKSSMRRHLLADEHVQACHALLLYKYAGGYDCSTPGNRRCPGVWKRQQERHATCLEAQ